MNEKKSSLYKVIKSLKRSKSSIGDPSASIFKDKKKAVVEGQRALDIGTLRQCKEGWLVGCMEFIVLLENFALLWRRHHCR